MRMVEVGTGWYWLVRNPDGMAPSRMVGVSASVNLPLHHMCGRGGEPSEAEGWGCGRLR